MTSKEEAPNVVIKSIGYFLMGAAILFVSAIVFVYVYVYLAASPKIYSDTEARNFLQSHFGEIRLPGNAHHLYAARRGWLMGAMYYGAFSLNSRKECEEFFKENFDCSIDDFEEVEELNDHFINTAPDTWKSKYQNPNWQIQRESEIYFIEKHYVEIAFVPGKFRIYMIRSMD